MRLWIFILTGMENRCFLPIDYTSTTTLYVSNYLVEPLPYYCAWDNAAEDISIICQLHHKNMSAPTPNYITSLESYLL